MYRPLDQDLRGVHPKICDLRGYLFIIKELNFAGINDKRKNIVTELPFQGYKPLLIFFFLGKRDRREQLFTISQNGLHIFPILNTSIIEH